jgi:hypothetical protein
LQFEITEILAERDRYRAALEDIARMARNWTVSEAKRRAKAALEDPNWCKSR